MNSSAGDSRRGSTPPRWLGAIALRTAAAICAIAALITLLILLYTSTRDAAGQSWALAALAAALATLTLLALLGARAVAGPTRAQQALADAREELRQSQEHAAASAAPPSPDPTSVPPSGLIPDLGPWIRVLGATAPLLAGLVTLVGPLRIIRLTLRIWSAVNAYHSIATNARAEQTPHPSRNGSPTSSTL